MGLESIILAEQLHDQATVALQHWALQHTLGERLDAIPLKTSRTWFPLHETIHRLGLEQIVFQKITEIQAQEQITLYGIDGIPGYKDLICLATLLAGEKKNQTEAGMYFRNLAKDLPLLTEQHQGYIEKCTIEYVQGRTAAQLREEIFLSPRAGFSFDPDANAYNPFLAELSKKIKGDRALQYALFTGWTDIEALEQITQKGVDGLPGFHSLIGLATILSGESRPQEEVGIYLKELAKEQDMPILTAAHRDYMERFDHDYIEGTSKEMLCEELPIIGKENPSLNPASGKYSPFLAALAQKISADRKLQFALFKKITGIEAQEQIINNDAGKIVGYKKLKGLATLLRGTPGTTAQAGEYFRNLAQDFDMPLLTNPHQTYVDSFDIHYVDLIPAAMLLDEIRQIGATTLDPAGQNYSPFFQQLAAKIGAGFDLQLALARKLGPLFTHGDNDPGLRTLNALLSHSMDLEERANIHVAALRRDVDESNLSSLSEANRIITDYGRAYFTKFLHGVGLGKYDSLLGLLCFPHLLYAYADGILETPLRDFEKRKFAQVNVLKMARNTKNEPLSRHDYYAFVRSIFLDEETTDPEVVDYISKGDLGQVTILEETIDPHSRNPNFRLRMFLATNPELSSNATLNAFVKLYARAQERDLETAFNNYLYTIAQVSSVGKARCAQLGQGVVMQCDDTGEYTYTLCPADAIQGRPKQSYGYALITPFVNIRNLEDELEDKEHLFSRVNAALAELHTKGMASLTRITQLSQEQGALLEQHLQPVDYEQQSTQIMCQGGELFQMLQTLGMMNALTEAARQYPSFIHGDLHPRNIGVKKDDEIVLVDFESEYSGIGAPQLDLAKLYSYKSLGVSMKEQVSLVHDYMQRRQITDENFVFGFHAAVLYNTFVHMRYVTENTGRKYTLQEAASSLAQDSAVLLQHAAQMYARTTASELVELAQQEFKLSG